MPGILQVFGVLSILGAYALVQAHVLRPTAVTILMMNACGAAALAVVAFWARQWGFLALESTWTTIAVVGLVMNRSRGVTGGPPDALSGAGT